MQSAVFTVRSSFFDRHRLLTIDPGYLEFDDQNRVGVPPTRFLKEEIESIRYGLKGIRGYRFYIGRIYCIDVRDTSGRVIRIRLKSLYRVRRKLLAEKYSAILRALFQYYFNAISKRYIQQFQEGQLVEILGVSLDKEGVLFDDKVGKIAWDFIGTTRYRRYYSLFSEEDPTKYKVFVYLDQWNAGILYAVMESILKLKFPNRK